MSLTTRFKVPGDRDDDDIAAEEEEDEEEEEQMMEGVGGGNDTEMVEVQPEIILGGGETDRKQVCKYSHFYTMRSTSFSLTPSVLSRGRRSSVIFVFIARRIIILTIVCQDTKR